uniref:Uncharacterized protein n=1 Tax=viral metagenome TaxID=1070528 RepID=A0A6M3IZC8_9ZZZZ
MTDRYHSLTVVFDQDIRDDDVEPILIAIKMIKGVLSVKPKVADMDSYMAEERVRNDLGKKLWDVLYPKNSI